jgi:molybdenum cofactor synthesis domain-containing protein
MEIVCVGNELLIGKILNTNASWLAKRATSLGITVKRITVVADVIAEMVTVFCEVLARKPKFLVVTGGLGPTFDDMTLQGLAKALNRPLEVNSEALQMVRIRYAAYAKIRNINEAELTPPRVKMAMMPQGALPIANPVGTAPGVQTCVNGTIITVLPGVPSEMEAIFETAIAPLLRETAGDVGFYENSLFVDHIMESVLAPMIDKVMHDNPLVYIKSHPKHQENKSHIELHFYTSGKPNDQPHERLVKAVTELSALIKTSGGKVAF